MNPSGILSALASHAQSLGLFTNVLTHEPKSAPATQGVHYALWCSGVRAVGSTSGLNSATLRLDVMGRVYLSAMSEPADAIEARLMDTALAVMAAYCGDFELGGLVRHVDVYGQAGNALMATAGYVTQDKAVFRSMDISLGMIVNDALNTEA